MERKTGEMEIRKEWENGEFQKKHENARAQVELYMKELDGRYRKKTGYGLIRYMESRMKTPESILNKLERKNLECSADNMVTRLHDISGVRVICLNLKDIYWIVRRISGEKRYGVLKVKDYIRKPKKNGYESYHMVLQIPAGEDEDGETVPVELQLRTIIMDAWASMDNRVSYKKVQKPEPQMQQRMKKYAKTGRQLDKKLQELLDDAACV